MTWYAFQIRALSKNQLGIVRENAPDYETARRKHTDAKWLHDFFRYWFLRWPVIHKQTISQKELEEKIRIERQVRPTLIYHSSTWSEPRY